MAEQGRFGFIGLGNMGGAMAARIAGHGVPLEVFDLSEAARTRFAGMGIPVASSVAALARGCDVLLACLPNAAASRTVAAEVAAAAPGRLAAYAETSTLGPAAVQDLAATLHAAGIPLVDAPISGGPGGATAGTLTCFLSGPAAALARLKPVLDALGRNHFVLGTAPGLAQTMKLGNNLLAAANLAITSEVVRMLEAAGIAPDTAVAAINVSTGRNRASEVVFPAQILSDRFDQGAHLDILAKDTALLVEAAETIGTDATLSRAVRDCWAGAADTGLGWADITRIYDWAGRRHDPA